MIDKDQINFTKHSINQNKGLYQMANEGLAEEMFPYMQKIIPGMRLIKCGRYQWFAADRKAVKRLVKKLTAIKEENLKEVEEINIAISQMK